MKINSKLIFSNLSIILYTNNTILELEENHIKSFYLKRLGFFIFNYILLNIGFHQFLDTGNLLAYPLHNFLFPLLLVIVLGIIYCALEFIYLKSILIKKILKDKVLYHLGFFTLEIIIFIIWDLKIHPEIQLFNDIRPYLFSFIYSIIISIGRLKFIREQKSM
ncbi:MAG: hypothetical protein N4A48_09080 [Tepidibacter sp.]|jgi:hypothetical protein|uniref:hypothetical protein n=1 Tax=Tepidibacter sp. TaxID=2529387 RepID=UPI0025EC3B80|nr:hypothetical protein [Tepidibacter sp.]MCT4508899.1 hypothetical protein [Tepidibacter sp.]